MKVLVVGSLRHLKESARQEAEEACREIGKQLVNNHITLVVGSDSRNTADYHVLLGAGQAARGANVIAIYPKTNKEKFAEFRHTDNYNFEHDQEPGRWFTQRGKQVQEADAVLLIGGASGTRDAAVIAYASKKPILPIPYFGGAAAQIYEYEDFERFLTRKEWENIAERWDKDGSPRVVVNILMQMGSGGPPGGPGAPPRPPGSTQPPPSSGGGVAIPKIVGWFNARTGRAIGILIGFYAFLILCAQAILGAFIEKLFDEYAWGRIEQFACWLRALTEAGSC